MRSKNRLLLLAKKNKESDLLTSTESKVKCLKDFHVMAQMGGGERRIHQTQVEAKS